MHHRFHPIYHSIQYLYLLNVKTRKDDSSVISYRCDYDTITYTVVNLAAARKWAGSTGKIAHLTEYRYEVTAFAVSFRSVSESYGGPLTHHSRTRLPSLHSHSITPLLTLSVSYSNPRAAKWYSKLRQMKHKARYLSTIDTTPEMKAVSHFSIPRGVMGQPTCYTHPHLVEPGHLTCGITQAEFRERRDSFVNKLATEVQNIHKTHIIVIPAASKQYMSDKIPYVFRQNSDFFYLTGCLEPSAVLVLLKPSQTESYKSIMFVHEKDTEAELWEGPRTGCTAAVQLFAVDEARPIENFPSFLRQIVPSSKPSILWYHNESPVNLNVHNTVCNVLNGGTTTLADPLKTLHFMRVLKTPAEIELMKETCEIGSQSMNTAMACTKPGVSEASLNAILEYSCRTAGAEHLAFPPVVAGGARGTHIHYITNNQILLADEMVLVDSGSQRWLYTSDISRTWPVSGKFSSHHRILYELVLNVQKRLIDILGEHRPPLDQLFNHMCRLLGKHLQEEGIISRNIDGHELISCAFRLCPHHVSHYLGMDVHDTPLVRRAAPVQSNMIVTVEPGIYTRPEDETVPPEFRGVAIRIEDDVLLTDEGPVVLTNSCMKEVNDIEALVGKHDIIRQ
ncbi:Xaa-Pro aminopeptidase 3 [Eumeta japonica]|uniref:Xaa-Pro aminopeptidase 3 n=1 Tax=Eumeta variegata TaxID=151549 RepID=A0A4C1T1G8_EUMVA|nr:Xaa-Pro aminopeptidase 3 [Eumeta japonica]